MPEPTRRDFLKGTAAALASASLSGSADAVAVEPAPRPNIVLIMSDDQGYGDLGCTGNPDVRTPNIDKLYAESTRLTRYHNCPVCSPTRASLMTGRYNYRTCAIDTFRGRSMMHPDEVTIAEMLSANGYKTGIFGKWHLGDCYPMRACDQGFQESLVIRGGGLAQPSDFPGTSGYFDPTLLHNGIPEPHKGYCTDIFATAAVDFLERHKSEPFFLYLATNVPHAPMQVDEKYAKPYLDKGLNEKTAKYYGMVANLDENVGRVLEAIDRSGLRESTVVIFMTDNGAQFGDDAKRFNAGMRGIKGTVYEGGIRVPFFARWPGKFTPGKDVDKLAAHIDVTPTILDLCQVTPIDVPKQDGKSLAPLLTQSYPSWWVRTLFFQWHRGNVPEPYNNCCAMTQEYKLVNGVELYDLQADPGEARDIAAENPEMVKQLRKEYEAWFDDVSATRGYEPPTILVGDDHAETTYLTLQDMRDGDSAGYGPGGYWMTRFVRAGAYDIIVRFAPEVKGGPVELQIGGKFVSAQLADGTTEVTMTGIQLLDGPAYIRAHVNDRTPANGARYVDIVAR